MKKLMVLDGNSVINRAFYGVRANLSTKEGQPTNAIVGFLNILHKFLEEEEPEALCVTFDRRGPTFRHLAYEGYKSNRKGMPEELVSQLALVKEILQAMNIPCYEMDGWEADDLLGTIAHLDEQAGWHTVIVSGDRDVFQLVNEWTEVRLITTQRGKPVTETVTQEVIEEKYGFAPACIVDLKALMGDKSDQIPGVKGIGEKGARELIQTYGSIQRIYEQLPQWKEMLQCPIQGHLLKKLEQGEEEARLSYELATIRRDAPISFIPEEQRRRGIKEDELYQLFSRLELTKMIQKYQLKPPKDSLLPMKYTYEVVTQEERARELMDLWREKGQVSLLTLPNLEVFCVAHEGEEGLGHGAVFLARCCPIYDFVLRMLGSGQIDLQVYGAKELIRQLMERELPHKGVVFDVQLAAYLLSSTDKSYDLEVLAQSYGKWDVPSSQCYLEKDAFGLLSSWEKAGEALACHTVLVGYLAPELGKKLEDLGMKWLFEKMELPLCPLLAEMECRGILVDQQALTDFGERLEGMIAQVQEKIFQYADYSLNLNSPQQLGQLLFEELGLPTGKKTKTGYSTNVDVLEKLRGQHPIIEELLEYRHLSKLQSTYVEGLGKMIGQDGRIHTCFQNTVTATGRLSSTDPNLQNIPIRTSLGGELRRMFVASPGCVLVDGDYSQIELRLLAHQSGDQRMIQAFQSGQDFHARTASEVFGIPVEQVTAQMRRQAKAVNFGIVYGISDFSLSQDLDISVAQAKEYIQRYFQTYSTVHRYMEEVVLQAKQQGYVDTWMGRRRWLPEIQSSQFVVRSFGKRVALNSPLQGAAADLIKLAMLSVDQRMKEEGLQGRLILQIHDELLVECPKEEGEQVAKILKEGMEGAATLSVPLLVDTAIGVSWSETHG